MYSLCAPGKSELLPCMLPVFFLYDTKYPVSIPLGCVGGSQTTLAVIYVTSGNHILVGGPGTAKYQFQFYIINYFQSEFEKNQVSIGQHRLKYVKLIGKFTDMRDYPIGLGLWCLMPLPTIFHLPVYRGGQFYWWRKPKYPQKTTDLLVSH